MNIEQYFPYIIQLIGTVIGFAFILGKYKAAFNHHEKILNQHEKILDRHEKVIDGIIVRLDSMNSEINFMKGFVLSKKPD